MTSNVARLSALAVAVCSFVGCGGSGATGPVASAPTGGETTPGGETAPAGGGGETAAPGDSAGKPPDFELDTLDGSTVRLSDHLGKSVILIDFWATFCDPCLASMPHLDELYKKHKAAGFVVLGISIDGPDSQAQVKAEVAKLRVTFPILLDTETRVVSLYNPKTSAPYSVLIGRDGHIIAKKEGYSTGDHGALDKDVEAALARK